MLRSKPWYYLSLISWPVGGVFSFSDTYSFSICSLVRSRLLQCHTNLENDSSDDSDDSLPDLVDLSVSGQKSNASKGSFYSKSTDRFVIPPNRQT